VFVGHKYGLWSWNIKYITTLFKLSLRKEKRAKLMGIVVELETNRG
jgi:hypothetical protein